MKIKYTPAFLTKLEEIFSESNYFLRYEKGNFKSGYCILREKRVVVINKYFTTEGKINCLIDILKQIAIDHDKLTPPSKSIYEKVV
ncbi:MAG: hypothetical protein ACFB0B_05245 [Thermonemataceae bacterium]